MLSRATRLGTMSMCPHTRFSIRGPKPVFVTSTNCRSMYQSISNYIISTYTKHTHTLIHPGTEATIRAYCRRMRIRKICKCDCGVYCCSKTSYKTCDGMLWCVYIYYCYVFVISHLLARYCFGFWSTSMCSMHMNP